MSCCFLCVVSSLLKEIFKSPDHVERSFQHKGLMMWIHGMCYPLKVITTVAAPGYNLSGLLELGNLVQHLNRAILNISGRVRLSALQYSLCNIFCPVLVLGSKANLKSKIHEVLSIPDYSLVTYFNYTTSLHCQATLSLSS